MAKGIPDALQMREVKYSEKTQPAQQLAIAKSLLGRVEGDEVTIPIPSGQKRFEVLELETIHTKAGGDGDGPDLNRTDT